MCSARAACVRGHHAGRGPRGACGSQAGGRKLCAGARTPTGCLVPPSSVQLESTKLTRVDASPARGPAELLRPLYLSYSPHRALPSRLPIVGVCERCASRFDAPRGVQLFRIPHHRSRDVTSPAGRALVQGDGATIARRSSASDRCAELRAPVLRPSTSAGVEFTGSLSYLEFIDGG
ncbi:hypothetical protein WOLCODRAFT_157725 [Wolfiporia cocos MD-104 SS10]|uniref:Uncharacterized protein n=1 Tax=Wolfiporia cocos (strain MD-104) TaxID=742152 RepID=A0A2H3JK40_WOLCO|nr:hypothetical protein WOLCODRAFT_157725 [Wolfiporia cocos MD-104 SS10]